MALTAEQELILDYLCEREAETAAQVARYASLPKPETIAILHYLADKGYVERTRWGRAYMYHITDAGRKAAIMPNPVVWTA